MHRKAAATIAIAIAMLEGTSAESRAAMAQPSSPSGEGAMDAACRAFRAAKASPQPVSQPSAPVMDAANLREFFRRADVFGFTGGVHLAQRGHPIYSQTFGYSDRARRTEMTADTIFDIGSVSKQFTAAAILRLEELGRLRTEDRISKYLDGVPPDKRNITIHQLLTHSAGLPHDVGNNQTHRTRDQAVAEIFGAPLESPPGAHHSYSNAGYALLAAIVEKASGESFEGFMRRELWLPAGLQRTGMVLGGLPHQSVAEGTMFDGPLPPNLYRTPDRDGPNWLVRGAGYMLSTLSDLARWMNALRQGRVLTDASRRKLFWPHVAEGKRRTSFYGYGWALFSNPDGSCRIAHDGSAGVHYDFLAFYPDLDATLVAFNTQERSPWRGFLPKAQNALAGLPLDIPRVGKNVRTSMSRVAGDYRLPTRERMPVRFQDGHLFIEVENAATLRAFSPWPMLPQADIADLPDRQALVDTLMNGIARGDYLPVLSRLQDRFSPEEEKAFWAKEWPQWLVAHGSYLGADLVGTVELEPGQRRTLALLRFSHGSVVVGIIHYPTGKIYIDWMPQHFQRFIYLAPQTDGTFLTWAPNTGRQVRVRFATDVMVVESSHAKLTARRSVTAVRKR